MSIDISAYLPDDTQAAARAALTPVALGMRGSKILAIARSVRGLQAEGRDICNLTVGDFSPDQFQIPVGLSRRIKDAVDEGQTNYPPADGLPELRAAVAHMYSRDLGLDYGAEGVCVGSGARPPIFASWQLFTQPGDVTVSFLPMWNVGYYAQLFQTRHRFVRTLAAHNFFPTVDQVAEAITDARLVMINSPLNPTGTVIDPSVLRGIGQLLVDENKRRERDGKPSCILLYDQVYWKLTSPGVEHRSPVQLVPECAPYVVHVDAVSKWFAGTGLRVGWAVLPPYLQAKMRGLIGHIGAWAPRPIQAATAAILEDSDETDAYLTTLNRDILARLTRLHDRLSAMRDAGLPVDVIPPQGAIYLSLRVELVGRGFDDNESIRRFLLEEAGLAVVPFQAFDMAEDTGWFRMSVGAVGLDGIDAAMDRMETALRARVTAG